MSRGVTTILTLVVATVSVAACAGATSGVATPTELEARFANLHQFDIALERKVVATVRSTWNGTAVVRATHRNTSGRVVTLGKTDFRSVEGTVQRLSIRLSASSADFISGCRPADIRLTAERRNNRPATSRWQRVALDPPQCGRFFAPSSIWNAALRRDATLDSASKLLSDEFRRQVDSVAARRYGPVVNTTRFSVPIFTVPKSQKRLPVILDRKESYANPLRKTFAEGVPIPPGAIPAAGTDRNMVIWQPSTDTMWEFFVARRLGSRWHADFGGRIDGVRRSTGAFYSASGLQLGASASSLAIAGGLMTPAELGRGTIDHALAVAIPATRYAAWALPASRSDGNVRSTAAIPEGAHFRLDPDLDVGALGLTPLVSMMATAAQKYGIVVRDGAGTVAFYARDPAGAPDPYARILGPAGLSLRGFPWGSLELLKMNLRSYSNTVPKPAGPDG